MIATLLRISWTNLRRDRVAQALTFLLPILFFSIFASVFGSQGRNSTARVRIAVVDEDGSEMSRRVVTGLKTESALRVRTTAGADEKGATLDRATAERLVQNGDVPVAVILPKGLGATAMAFGPSTGAPRIQLLADVSDPIAPQMVGGLLQKVTMTAAPDLMMKGGLTQFEKYAGAMTPGQRSAVNAWLTQLTPGSATGTAATAPTAAAAALVSERFAVRTCRGRFCGRDLRLDLRLSRRNRNFCRCALGRVLLVLLVLLAKPGQRVPLLAVAGAEHPTGIPASRSGCRKQWPCSVGPHGSGYQ